MREWIQNNPKAAMIGSVVVLVLVIFWITWQLVDVGGPSYDMPEKTWFYDTGTGELFAVEVNTIPPIEAPSGEQGVLAHVYSCSGSCAEDEREVLYLERYTPEAREAAAELDQAASSSDSLEDARQAELASIMAGGREVRRPQDTRWQPATSGMQGELVISMQDDCPEMRRCSPTKK